MLICISKITTAQITTNDLIELWNAVSPLITAQIKTPIVKEIVTNAVPKIIKDDVNGAITEVSASILKVYKINLDDSTKQKLQTQFKSISVDVKKQDFFAVGIAMIGIGSELSKRYNAKTNATFTTAKTDDTETINLLNQLKKEMQDKKNNVIKNFNDFIIATGTYSTSVFEVSNVKVILKNKSNFKIDDALVEVKFVGEYSGEVYCTQKLEFKNILATNITNTLNGQNCSHGKKVIFTLKKITSYELGLVNKTFN